MGVGATSPTPSTYQKATHMQDFENLENKIVENRQLLEQAQRSQQAAMKMIESVQTPVASVTIEASQTAKGNWTGSVKVHVTALMDMDSVIDCNVGFEAAEKQFLAATATADTEGGFPEADLHSFVQPHEYMAAPCVLVATPTAQELELRSAVGRLLRSGMAQVIGVIQAAEAPDDENGEG